MTKIEEVARAIRVGRRCEAGDVPCPFCLWGPDDLTAGQDETGCIWLARAAIETMREPTDEMIDAGVAARARFFNKQGFSDIGPRIVLVNNHPAGTIYQAMIGAVLEK